MSRSSFASFHLTGIKASSGKLMQSSVDRLFENDGEVFMSNTFNEFQVIISFHFLIVKVIFLIEKLFAQGQILPSIDEIASINSKSPEPILSKIRSSSYALLINFY